MLESRGYHVTSVLGNDKAFGLDAAVIAAADLIVIGFSAPYPVRAAMIHWFKQQYPNIPVVALRFHRRELPRGGWRQRVRRPRRLAGGGREHPQKINISLQLTTYD